MSKLKQLPSIHKLKIKPIFVLPKPESRSLEWNKKNEVLKLVVNQIMIWNKSPVKLLQCMLWLKQWAHNKGQIKLEKNWGCKFPYFDRSSILLLTEVTENSDICYSNYLRFIFMYSSPAWRSHFLYFMKEIVYLVQ